MPSKIQTNNKYLKVRFGMIKLLNDQEFNDRNIVILTGDRDVGIAKIILDLLSTTGALTVIFKHVL